MSDESRCVQGFVGAYERRIKREGESGEWSGMTKCFDCNGTGVDVGSLNQPEPCILCLGAGEVAPGDPQIEYDLEHQTWVKDGVYLHCGHTAADCSCLGRLHAGELSRRVA